jgi:hypothetical protein
MGDTCTFYLASKPKNTKIHPHDYRKTATSESELSVSFNFMLVSNSRNTAAYLTGAVADRLAAFLSAVLWKDF